MEKVSSAVIPHNSSTYNLYLETSKYQFHHSLWCRFNSIHYLPFLSFQRCTFASMQPGYIDNQKSNEGEEQQRKTQGSIQTNEKQISPDLQPNTEEKKLDVII